MLRFFYSILSIFNLFKSAAKGGPSGAAKTLGRRAAHRQLSKWMR